MKNYLQRLTYTLMKIVLADLRGEISALKKGWPPEIGEDFSPKTMTATESARVQSFVIDCVVLARPRLEPTFAIHGEAEPTPSDDPEDSLLKGEPSKERETHNGLFVETEHGVFARLERYAIIPVERFQELMEAEALYVERFGPEKAE